MPVAVEAIWLRTTDDKVEVLVQIGGQWKMAICENIGYDPRRERLSPVGHIIEASGIRNLKE